MATEKKIQAVQEMTETLSRSSVVIGADYRGLSVEQATALRHAMRDAGVQIQVVKNTLFLRAAEAAGMSGVGELAEGPTVFNSNTARQLRQQEARETELYEQIGRLKMELEWLKKKAAQFD